MAYTYDFHPDGSVTIHPPDDGEMTPEYLEDAARSAVTALRQGLNTRDAEAWRAGRGGELAELIGAVWDGSVTDEYLAVLSLAYLEVAATHLPVMRTLADMVGRSPNTVKMQLVRARDRGLLLGAPGNRVGGKLTTKARKLLAAE